MPTPEVEIAKHAAETGPFVWSNLWPTIWMIAVAAFGGAVSFIQKVKTGKARALNIAEFVGEILIAAFAGLVTGWICAAFNVNLFLTYAGVAISGHMGARAIFIFEQWAEKKAEQL